MLFTGLRAAWRVFWRGEQAAHPHDSPCTRCAELKQEVAYWRGREERATEALLAKAAGVVGVVLTPKPETRNQLGGAMAALQITSIDSKRSQPGQGATRGAS